MAIGGSPSSATFRRPRSSSSPRAWNAGNKLRPARLSAARDHSTDQGRFHVMQTRSIPLASFGLAMRRRFWLLAAALAVGAAGVTAVPRVANAQGLPDFTDLVEKVGPAVV